MRWRDQIALTLPSLLLRTVLALTFIWAGVGKLVGTTTVVGDDAARLHNLQVPLTEPAPGAQTAPDGRVEEPLPDPEPDPAAETELDQTLNQALEQDPEPAEPTETPEAQEPGTDEPSADEDERSPLARSDRAPRFELVQLASAPAVGSDFPDPVEVHRVYTIALLIDKCADPGLTADSRVLTPILPSWMGSGRTPVYAAWAAAITEVVAGGMLLFGLLTRLCSLSTLTIMLVAIWTTTIGPAAMHSSDAILGFIPHVDDPWAPSSYSVGLWQLALAVMSLSVLFLGPGPLSLDRLIFGTRRDPFETAPPSKRKHKHGEEPQGKRGGFDRTPDPNP